MLLEFRCKSILNVSRKYDHALPCHCLFYCTSCMIPCRFLATLVFLDRSIRFDCIFAYLAVNLMNLRSLYHSYCMNNGNACLMLHTNVFNELITFLSSVLRVRIKFAPVIWHCSIDFCSQLYFYQRVKDQGLGCNFSLG